MQITFPTWRCSICSWSCYGPAAWSWVLLLTVLTGNGNVACITNEFRWGAARRPLCSFWQVTKASCHCSFQPTPSCSHSSPHFFGTNCFFHILPRGKSRGPLLEDYCQWQAPFQLRAQDTARGSQPKPDCCNANCISSGENLWTSLPCVK